MRSAAQGVDMAKGAKNANLLDGEVVDTKAVLNQRLSTDNLETHLSFAFPDSGISSILVTFSAPLYEMPSLVCTVASWGAALRRLYTMALAPLRRIRLRTIEVLATHQDKPTQFVIIDQLECGHTHSDYQWTLLDLVNPYSEQAKTKRHRCRECQAVIAKKRPQGIRSLTKERLA